MSVEKVDWSSLEGGSESRFFEDWLPYECVFVNVRSETSQAGREYTALVFEVIDTGDTVRVPAFLGPVRGYCQYNEVAPGDKVTLMCVTENNGGQRRRSWFAVDS